MKKLKLNASAFQNGEVLTRMQLKNVLGGSGSGSGGTGLCDEPPTDQEVCYNCCVAAGGDVEECDKSCGG